MKKIVGVTIVLCLTGCACSRSEKQALYQKALLDTNADLTQCRDENVELHKVVERDHKLLVAYRKKRK